MSVHWSTCDKPHPPHREAALLLTSLVTQRGQSLDRIVTRTLGLAHWCVNAGKANLRQWIPLKLQCSSVVVSSHLFSVPNKTQSTFTNSATTCIAFNTAKSASDASILNWLQGRDQTLTMTIISNHICRFRVNLCVCLWDLCLHPTGQPMWIDLSYLKWLKQKRDIAVKHNVKYFIMVRCFETVALKQTYSATSEGELGWNRCLCAVSRLSESHSLVINSTISSKTSHKG